MREVRICAGIGILFLGLIGCQTPRGPSFDVHAKTRAMVATNFTAVPSSNSVEARMLGAPTNLFTLGPGDTVEIDFFQQPEIRATRTVGPDGKIYFYLLPGLDVWGLTLPETQALLAKELTRYFRLTNNIGTNNSTAVGVTLKDIESKHVWLLGQFQAPGIYPLTTPATVLETISMAGGARSTSLSGTTEELADLRHSFVIRDGKMLPVDFWQLLVEGKMSENIYLQPDDFVYLPSALSKEIYVLGHVRMPRAIPYSDQTTLVSAIASAGGAIRNAYISHVAIVRGSLAKPQIAIEDYDSIIHGKKPDVLLEPQDIVYVPASPYRILSKYLDLIVTTFVRAVAINEGARAVMRNAAPVGVGITVNPMIAPAQ